jgi:hypothetical protein
MLVHGRPRIVFTAITVLLLLSRVQTRPPDDSARTFLAASFGVTSADLARIDAGQVFSRTLEATDRREVSTLGIVRIRITPEFYVEQLGDIASFKRDAAVLQIGTFGDRPDLQNVERLTLDESDIGSLRECQVGKCGVQLSADAIERFREDVDWRRSDASRQANSLMRRVLVEYVTAYLAGGAALKYADRSEPLDLDREFASLIESKGPGWQHFPRLLRHLVEYPAGATASIADQVYWSKEKVGRRTVVSVTHLAVAGATGNSPAEYAIGSKQIYGSHYFDASLGLTVLVRDRAAAAPVTYLVYFNRSRVDVFRGLFGGITRRVVTSRARSTVSDQLERMQGTLERQFAGAAQPY